MKRTTAPRPVASQPVDQHGLNAALALFVGRFVVDDKRTQVHKRLLTAERRVETLGTLARWLAGRVAPLEGAERSPAGLEARVGAQLGVQLDGEGARRLTIAGALERGRSRSSLFIGDSGRIALLTTEEPSELLCTWP